MSPASYLTAPPRVAARIVPPATTIGHVETWLPLAFFVVAAVGSLVHAALRGWRAWRAFRRTSRRTSRALARVADLGASAERRAVSLSGHTERLDGAIRRLQESLAELAVLRAAFAESRSVLASVRGSVPRK